MTKTYFVYILECSDGSYYIGITNDLVVRVDSHQLGLETNSYTYSRRPVRLVYYEEFDDIGFAIDREKQLKRWRREKKEALINGHEDDLPLLARCYQKK